MPERYVRELDVEDSGQFMALCARSPVENVFPQGRVELLGGIFPRRLGGELWGYFERDHLVSACWAGSNLVPIEVTDRSLGYFVDFIFAKKTRFASIFGPRWAVMSIWEQLHPFWGPAREKRLDQPLMALTSPSSVEADPRLEVTSIRDLDIWYPASAAMFEEEVGTFQDQFARRNHYERAVQLVRDGHSFSVFEGEGGGRRVVFKAEVGALSSQVAQIQGVWVNPLHRGRGLSAPGMSAVVDRLLELAPIVSLYVNAYNRRALSTYRNVGFKQVGTFATIML